MRAWPLLTNWYGCQTSGWDTIDHHRMLPHKCRSSHRQAQGNFRIDRNIFRQFEAAKKNCGSQQMALFPYSSVWRGGEPVVVWACMSSAVLLPGFSLDQWLLLCPCSGLSYTPIFLYRNTKSMLMPAFVTRAKQKPKHGNEYSLLRQMHNFIRISTWIWSPLGWRVTSVHRCALQTPWIFTSSTWIWWFKKKKYWFGWLSFSANASCSRKIRWWLQIGMPSICKQCGLQFPIRPPPTPCNQKERKKGSRTIAGISPWSKVTEGRNNILITGPRHPVQSRSLKLTSVCLFSWVTPLCYLCKRLNRDSVDTEAVTSNMTSLQTFQAAN